MNQHILENGFLQIEYLTDSLRITELVPTGGPNMLAELVGLPPIPTAYGDFYFRGGHRLWHAPEAMPRTFDNKLEVRMPEMGKQKLHVFIGHASEDSMAAKRLSKRLRDDSIDL